MFKKTEYMIILIVIFSLLSVESAYSGQRKNFDFQQTIISGAKSFEEIFQKQGEIILNLGEELIGNIHIIKIGFQNQFLLLDRRFGDAILVDNSGKLIKKLNVEKDLPGYHWHASVACFLQEGDMAVWCGLRDILLFDKHGEFKKKINLNEMTHYRDFTADKKNDIFTYSFIENKISILKINLNGKLLKKESIFPKKYYSFLHRFEEGGCIELDNDGYIYQTHLSGPEIYKYSNDLKLVEIFNRKPRFFKSLPINQIQMFNYPMENFLKIQKIMRSITQNLHLFKLNDSLYLSQYFISDEGKFALDIWSKTGQYYSHDDLRYNSQILAARNNFIYVAHQPEADEKGNVPNPIIIIYKMLFKVDTRKQK